MTPARTAPFPLVLAAPSGTGKTTIAQALVARSERFVFSVSVTTRPPREGEKVGRDYQFVSEAEFRGMVDRDELVEWAEVHGYLYGTPRAGLDAAREAGCFPILDIDVQGARQIRRSVPDAVQVFLLPPSASELVARLEGRATEGRMDLLRRLRRAVPELEAANEFDYVVVNEDLDLAIQAVEDITRGESHRAVRHTGVRDLINELRSDIDTLLEGDRDTVPASGP